MKAGFARFDVTPPNGTCIASRYFYFVPATGCLDALELNALAVSDEENTAVIIAADFGGMAAFCEATLCGDGGKAFEKAEEFLAAGKSVGVLIKDVMSFFNSCAVAKMCRDAKNILALPDTSFQEVARIAKAADAHALLRATEIFAEVEQALKYSASPRILFETAVLRASMPKTEYDIEALLARVAALESKLENGVVVKNDGGRVEVKQPEPVKVEQVEEQIEESDYVDVPEMEAPPDETETGGNVYFDEGFIPVKKEEPKQPKKVKEAVVGQ